MLQKNDFEHKTLSAKYDWIARKIIINFGNDVGLEALCPFCSLIHIVHSPVHLENRAVLYWTGAIFPSVCELMSSKVCTISLSVLHGPVHLFV